MPPRRCSLRSGFEVGRKTPSGRRVTLERRLERRSVLAHRIRPQLRTAVQAVLPEEGLMLDAQLNVLHRVVPPAGEPGYG